MKVNASGSAVLLVLIIMGVLTLFLNTALQESTFVRLFAVNQIIAEQHATLGRGLLVYGIHHAQKNYDELLTCPEAELEFLLPQMTGRVTFTGQRDKILISSSILKHEKVVFHRVCQLTKDSSKKFAIQGFQSEAFAL